MTSPPSSNSWNGRFIGDNQRYRLDKRLAGGGMGEVFLAMDTRVGQHVALKLLKDTLVASQEMRKRFEREIAVCAALQSDHIVKISDCGVTVEGYPFYVMEYLRGQTLRQLLLREKRLSVERTVSIIAQVCKGLQLAHAGVTLQRDGGKTAEHIQVIHRDLKPDNIFLVPTDLGEWVKILDFGVAKIRNDSSEQTNITNTFIGTFRYAAPEQIQSDKNLDARADIYSLGLILYEMLSAADPFGLSIKANNISEASWVLAHAYEPPKPLREQPGCESIPEQLEAVILKCLQKNPQNRFTSVADLDEALQAAAKPSAENVGNVDYDEAIALYPTVPRPTPDSETIPRVLTPEEGNLNDTMPPSPAIEQQGLDNETIPRAIAPEEQSSGEDETILRLQPVYHQNDEETIPRSVIQIEPSQGQDETIPRPQPFLNQNADGETIPRSHTPIANNRPEGTIFQPRPGQNHGSNNETVPRPLEESEPSQGQDETVPRPQPFLNQGSDRETVPRPLQQFVQNQPEGTIFQPRPQPQPENTPVTPPQTGKPEGTIFQPRPQPQAENTPVTPPQPSKPEGTIFQPRPQPQAENTPVTPPQTGKPEGTIFQPRPQAVPEGTIFQSRPQPAPEGTIFQPRPQPAPEGTIFQPKKNQGTAQPVPSNFWRVLGIVLAIGLALGAVIYLYPQLKPKQENNQNSLQNPNYHQW
ncbi:protein kinase [Tolypothrix sp. FACHB-123]|uniref:serine/threonine protein kinase n=1 Tax=Tolypothrix sp. FACHB-123 TaxID=2692868 RepID=UPI001686707A|nr:serine/threonine-protein kinase [Tolypothrix sp. FACHB-123]MBD2353985.1 protein kinase [Tolypothrix sp. FACHB-123]